MIYFNKFNVYLRKNRKGWPRKRNGEVIIYPVIALDLEKDFNSKMPDNKEIEDEEMEVLICFLLLANPTTGVLDWFNINEVRFNALTP